MTGTELAAWRRARGLTQRALGNALDVTAQSISNWEQRGAVSIPRWAQLALAGLESREGLPV